MSRSTEEWRPWKPIGDGVASPSLRWFPLYIPAASAMRCDASLLRLPSFVSFHPRRQKPFRSFAFRAQFKPIRPDLLHAALTKLPDRKFHFLSDIFIYYHCARGKINCAAGKAESHRNINDSRNGTCNGGKFVLPLRGQGKLARHL